MNGNPVTARGAKTSEFWLTVAFIFVVVASAFMRAAYGQGLTTEELLMCAGATGIHWYGRDSLKKAVLKHNGNGKVAA